MLLIRSGQSSDHKTTIRSLFVQLTTKRDAVITFLIVVYFSKIQLNDLKYVLHNKNPRISEGFGAHNRVYGHCTSALNDLKYQTIGL
ncbi:MAG: hypothetical protein RLY58_742 [Pseudomonadota bacterium]|jgi:hypothetical protein